MVIGQWSLSHSHFSQELQFALCLKKSTFSPRLHPILIPGPLRRTAFLKSEGTLPLPPPGVQWTPSKTNHACVGSSFFDLFFPRSSSGKFDLVLRRLNIILQKISRRLSFSFSSNPNKKKTKAGKFRHFVDSKKSLFQEPCTKRESVCVLYVLSIKRLGSAPSHPLPRPPCFQSPTALRADPSGLLTEFIFSLM